MSRETLFSFNRVLLLSILIISFTLPLLPVSLNDDRVNEAATEQNDLLLVSELYEYYQSAELDEVIASAQVNEIPTYKNTTKYILSAALLVYLLGALYSLVSLAISYVALYKLISTVKGKFFTIGANVKLVIHSDNSLSPMSWLNIIIMSEKDFIESGREIVTHEMAHIKRGHSIDIFIAEIASVILWFNPASHLLKQELKTIHEYQADMSVLNSGMDSKSYQMLLIKKAVGEKFFTIANNFNQSKLKNRINMMAKEKTKKVYALRALLLLPLLSVAITAFADKDVEIMLQPVNDFRFSDVFANDEQDNDSNALSDLFEYENNYIEQDTSRLIRGRIVEIDSSGKKHRNRIVISGDTIVQERKDAQYNRVDSLLDVKTKVLTIDARGFTVKGDGSVVVVDKNKDTVVYHYGYKPDVKQSDIIASLPAIAMVNGGDTIRTDQGKVLNFNITKNGTVVITPKDTVVYYHTYEGNGRVSSKKEIRKGDQNDQPLYVINGKVAKPEHMTKIDANMVENITVLKDEQAVKLYGNEAKNGVIVINMNDSTKKYSGYYYAQQDKKKREEIQKEMQIIFKEGQKDLAQFQVKMKNYLRDSVDMEQLKAEMKGAMERAKVEFENLKLTEEQKEEMKVAMEKAKIEFENLKLTEEQKEELKQNAIALSNLLSDELSNVKVAVGKELSSFNGFYSKSSDMELEENKLIVVDGEIVSRFDMKDIPEGKELKSIKFINGDKAEKKYGEAGKNGAYIITLKKSK